MAIPVARYTLSDVEINAEEAVYQGFFTMHELRLKHRLFSGEWSGEISREIFHRGQASAAVLYDPVNDTIGLVEQFRVGALTSEFGPWCLEVVAGMLEPGETPEALMRRELAEEAGIEAAELIHITSYYSTPGGCSEKIHLYCALCDLSAAGGIHGLDDENEDILLHVLPAPSVFAVMLNSRMNNAATLLGLQWLQLHRHTLRNDLEGVPL